MEEQDVNNQDALTALEVFKKALGFRPYLQQAVTGKDFSALSLAEMAAETVTPRIALHYVDKDRNIPALFFRFVGDGSPIIETIFYPYEAILYFLSEARAYVRWLQLPDKTDEEKENIAVENTIEMTLIMLDSFYRRADMMMESYTSEVVALWHLQKRQNINHFYAEHGNPIPYKKGHERDSALENTVNEYAKNVLKFWKFQGQSYENWQKMRLVEEYEVVYKHWNRLKNMLSDRDWREYAKAGNYKDTPDDLLEKLENTDRLENKPVEKRISELALEHAARRARLIKKRGVTEAVNRQRREGVKVSGFTSSQLFTFLREGRELIQQEKAIQESLAQELAPTSLEQNGYSAQVK